MASLLMTSDEPILVRGFLIPLNMITYMFHTNIILFASKMLCQTLLGYRICDVCSLLSLKIQAILNSGTHMAIRILDKGLHICCTFLLRVVRIRNKLCHLFQTLTHSRHLVNCGT